MRHVCGNANFARNAWKKGLQRPADPATLIGLALLVETLSLLAINIFVPPPFGRNPSSGLPELNGGMALLMQPLSTVAYFLILVGSTCWLQIRFRVSAAQCGRAAAKIAFLAGAPTLLAALLILSGVLGVAVVGPGDIPTTFGEHGFALTYYSAQPHDPAGWLLVASVVLRVPVSFCWGVLGWLLGRGFTHGRGLRLRSRCAVRSFSGWAVHARNISAI